MSLEEVYTDLCSRYGPSLAGAVAVRIIQAERRGLEIENLPAFAHTVLARVRKDALRTKIRRERLRDRIAVEPGPRSQRATQLGWTEAREELRRIDPEIIRRAL